MTRQEQEQKLRQRFIEEYRKIKGRPNIHQLVGIIQKFNLNPRLERAIYDSNARLAREWCAKELIDGWRSIHNVRSKDAQGNLIQEFVEEGMFTAEDYEIKAEDERRVLKKSYGKLVGFIEHCLERYGVKLEVGLDFIKPISLRRSARAQKAQRQGLFDEVSQTTEKL